MTDAQHRPNPRQPQSQQGLSQQRARRLPPGQESPASPWGPARIREAVLELLEGPLPQPGLPPIVQAGHPVLRQRASAYDGQLKDNELDRFITLMREVMLAAPGVGLAAPQIGIPLQVAVLQDEFDVDPETAAVRERDPLALLAVLNPRYTPLDDLTATFYEGCLSVSGLQAVVPRHRRVRLDYDQASGSVSAEFTGWQARIVQHETDHLNGILYLDRAELRSLTTNGEYAAHWSEPGIERARHGLGFLAD